MFTISYEFFSLSLSVYGKRRKKKGITMSVEEFLTNSEGLEKYPGRWSNKANKVIYSGNEVFEDNTSWCTCTDVLVSIHVKRPRIELTHLLLNLTIYYIEWYLLHRMIWETMYRNTWILIIDCSRYGNAPKIKKSTLSGHPTMSPFKDCDIHPDLGIYWEYIAQNRAKWRDIGKEAVDYEAKETVRLNEGAK